MSTTPSPVTADTIGGGPVKDPQDGGTHDYAKVETYTFKRCYEHYVNNSVDAYGYTEVYAGSPYQTYLNGLMIDEGWFIIPYWNPAIAMTVNDLTKVSIHSSAVRIKSLGFRVKQAMVMRQEVAVSASTTQINNNFASQPYFETYVDALHEWDREVLPRPATDTIPPSSSFTGGYDPAMLPNGGY